MHPHTEDEAGETRGHCRDVRALDAAGLQPGLVGRMIIDGHCARDEGVAGDFGP
jgi:hypothetical protein